MEWLGGQLLPPVTAARNRKNNFVFFFIIVVVVCSAGLTKVRLLLVEIRIPQLAPILSAPSD